MTTNLADLVEPTSPIFGTWSVGGWVTVVAAAVVFGIGAVACGWNVGTQLRKQEKDIGTQLRKRAKDSAVAYLIGGLACLGIYTALAWWASPPVLLALPIAVAAIGCVAFRNSGMMGAPNLSSYGGAAVCVAMQLGIGVLIVLR